MSLLIASKVFLRRYVRITQSSSRSYSTMATPYRIQVPVGNSGLLKFDHQQDEANALSNLLQKDLENHHVFFNTSGFHNHISHHLLSLYGMGGSVKDLQRAYANNATYQIKAKPPKEEAVGNLERDWTVPADVSKYLGKGKHYADFLRYFQVQMDKTSWRDVVKEHLFKDDERSNDMMARLFAGFLHPLIQLMYGIEWQQPALVAEGLAQAAVHENKLGELLSAADKAAAAAKQNGSRMGAIADLFDAVRENEKLVNSVRYDDSDNIHDGIMTRAPDEAIELLSRVKVEPDELEERTAEMIHAAAYVAAAAAFHPPHVPKFDFFLIHHINSIPFFLSVNKLPWIPTALKVRLLEWKIRMDVVQYVARGSPPLRLDFIRSYTPRDKTLVSKPRDLLSRFYPIPDDGHTIKLVRALILAQEVSEKYADRPWIRLRSEDEWLRVHYMLLDSTEKTHTQWVRSAGFEEAWNGIPKAK